MDMYCWGNNSIDFGQEMNCAIKDEIFDGMTHVPDAPWKGVEQLRDIAFGDRYTLFLTAKGKVYECETHGQVHNTRKRSRLSPFRLVAGLQDIEVSAIACGSSHSLVLTKSGVVMSWGVNDCGQLGQTTNSRVPTMVKVPDKKPLFVQIACGNEHSLALTNDGTIYSWGSNRYGQLGMSEPENMSNCHFPMHLTSIHGIPIATIACGGNHCFLISKSSAVYGWGRNNRGQLGLNDLSDRPYPTELTTLRPCGVRYVACGDEFSVFLTHKGALFTCGDGTHGQLGHGNLSNALAPFKVMKLRDKPVTQVACAKHYTLAFVPSIGQLYGFGQLGKIYTLPGKINGPWISPTLTANSAFNDAVIVNQIFSGGLKSVVTTTLLVDNVPPFDMRHPLNQESQIFTLSEQMDNSVLVDEEPVFVWCMHCSCLNGSFLLANDQHLNCSIENFGVDIRAAQKAFRNIRDVVSPLHKEMIWIVFTLQLIPSLKCTPADVESLRVYLILPLYHEFANSKLYSRLHAPFAQAIFRLSDEHRNIVMKWFSQMPMDYFKDMVENFLLAAVYIMRSLIPRAAQLGSQLLPHNCELHEILKLVEYFYIINIERESDRLTNEFFYLNELTKFIDIKLEYYEYMLANQDKNHICHFEFIFDATAKCAMLKADQSWQIDNFSHVLHDHQLNLYISREHIVKDSLNELQKLSNVRPEDLKKPLIIKFIGEDAEDVGGVRQEFFNLLLKKIFDPDYGMFKVLEESRLLWFADSTFENKNQFYLLGLAFGLAVYNLTVINLPLPLALYKKLLGKKVDLSDLHELLPSEAKSLKAILDYTGDDFKETFDLTFELSKDVFGQSITKPLIPNGHEIAVTLENRQEFVNLYVHFVLNQSIEMQCAAFLDGFLKVCFGCALFMFQPEELMAAILGTDDYDWQVLQDNCTYTGDYTPEDETINWFWSVFHDLSEEEKRKFLLFLTSSDRLPIQGMQALKIKIQPTYDDRYLPVAHTCFKVLDLPRYKSKTILKEKLLLSLQYSHGFGLV
ncbi:probable E3 ubiquitin-protein ligase HERC4 [Drosophila willistoni]|uniref:probable E3 ubiquitin-protein ligase HERC4 n=1 Tax=Drosophila willistoni TaxID=7260 RepID=UPI001F08573F|nr:probable E3 ubiquitin-protein ligase HERC4 [Drosophila willistoni]